MSEEERVDVGARHGANHEDVSERGFSEEVMDFSRDWLESMLGDGWKISVDKRGYVRLFKYLGKGKKEYISVPKGTEAYRYALELHEAANKAKEEDLRRSKQIEQARLDRRKPLVAREIEDQAWFKNLVYELGKNAFNLLIKHTDLSEEELTYEGWEKARDKLVAKLREIYDFWESNPTLRELGYEYRRVLVERDAAVKVANDLRVALREALSLLQAAITLMPKDALEKFMMLTAMSDLAKYVPRELDLVLSGGR